MDPHGPLHLAGTRVRQAATLTDSAHAHVVTTTTTRPQVAPAVAIRSLSNRTTLGKKTIDSGRVPRHPGRPADARDRRWAAVAFGQEALRARNSQVYAQNVIANARVLAEALIRLGAGGSPRGTGQPPDAAGPDAWRRHGGLQRSLLERAHITANKNRHPLRPASADAEFGLRLGSLAAADAGFGTAEFTQIGD